MRWRKKFSKEISWYVRTSPGILLVKAGDSLTAVDGVTGQQLWTLPNVKWNTHTSTSMKLRDRGRDMLEDPGMGVLFLNRVKLNGDPDWRLIALNLVTGQRLWDQPQSDDLLLVLPIRNTHDVLLISRHLDAGPYAAGLTITAAEVYALGIYGPAMFPPALYPSHLIVQRVNPLTGSTAWRTECPRMRSLQVLRDHLLLNKGAGSFSLLSLASGKIVRHYVPVLYDVNNLPLPALRDFPDGQVVYAGKELDCVSLNSFQLRWQIHKLGKINDIAEFADLTVVIGNDHVVAVDPKSGFERWRKKTNSPTTAGLWDRLSDAILYADNSGLHSIERATGTVLMERHLDAEFAPHFIRRASSDVVVTVSIDQVGAYNSKTGEKLFTAGRFSTFFRAYALQDHWPMPDDGQDPFSNVIGSDEAPDWRSRPSETLFSSVLLHRLDGYGTRWAEFLDAYETEPEKDVHKVWWVDPQTNRKVEFELKGKHHDVCRPLSMVFGVEGKSLWGAPIPN